MSKNQNGKGAQRKLLKQAYEYACGQNVEENFEKAFELFSEAGKHVLNDDVGWLVLQVFRNREDVLCRLISEGIKKNDAFAFYVHSVCPFYYLEDYNLPKLSSYEAWDDAAEYGDAEMKLLVGRRYLDDLRFGNQINGITEFEQTTVKTKASDYIRQAAIMGCPEAQLQYFVLCDRKLTGNEDVSEGLALCRQAAENGHRDAQFAFGYQLLTGKYTEKNQTEGIAWLEKTAKRGNTDAMMVLAGFYEKNQEKGEEAVAWYKKAAAKGDARAKCILTIRGADNYDLYGISTELVERMRLGDPLASELLKYLINNPNFSREHGTEISEDPKFGTICVKPIRNTNENFDEHFDDDFFNADEPEPNEEISKLKEAAKNGDVEAMVALGRYYSDSDDVYRACIWFGKAADRGDVRAKFYMTLCGEEHYDLYEIAGDLIEISAQGDRLATELIDLLISNPPISAMVGVAMSRDPETNRITYGRPCDADKGKAEDFMSESFESFNVYDERFEEVKLFGHTVIYDDIRMNKDDLPVGYYCYDVMHEDNNYVPYAIKESVTVNHMGLIISNQPIKLDEDGYRFISKTKREWRKTGEVMTFREYMAAFPPSASEI